MDKQKQIEEIVKFHCDELCSNGICKEDNKPCVINNGNYCAVIENAKRLLDRLIPENAVVLTRERYEWLTCCFGKFEEIMNDIKKSVRKETAEKFAERLKNHRADEETTLREVLAKIDEAREQIANAVKGVQNGD